MPYLYPLPLALRGFRRTSIGDRLGIMERLFGRKLQSEGIQWVETAPGLPWKVDLGNPCHRWMVYGDYADTGFLNWARSDVPEDGVIIDSGTNVGQFLPYLANIISEGRILAFEPSPYCVQWVQECLNVNPDLPIELIPKGLGREKKQLALEDTEGAHGLWGRLSQEDRHQKEKVQVTALTEAVRTREISQVSLWKLDVEGHELEALKGADELLAEKQIHALYVEVRAENRSEDVAFLQNHGYSPYETKRNGELKAVQEHPGSSTDLLFLPQ